MSNPSTGGTFLTAFAGFGSGAQLNGNLYVAPNVQIGNDFAADLTVLQSDLTGFSLISNNRWGAPKSLDWHLINPPDGQGFTPNPGGRMMVMPQPLTFAGYRTISSINSAFSLQPSAFDLETSVQLDASFRPQPSVPVPVPSGVFIDFTGGARNATSNAGAVQ